MFIVTYEKFVSGQKKGLTERHSIHFDTHEAASEWIANVRLLDKDKTFFNFKLRELA